MVSLAVFTVVNWIRARLASALPSGLVGRIRSWRVRRVIREFKPRIVTHDYGDVRLTVQISDPLSAGWYDRDWPSLPELQALQKSRLRRGALVFDFGAHQGIVAAMLAHSTGPEGKVVAVEASPHNHAVALRNMELNGCTHVEVVHAAVTAEAGWVSFSSGLNGQLDNSSGSFGRQAVRAVTIDDVAAEFGIPDVVFLDVEGAECLALRGARRVLDADTDFFVEVHATCGLERLGGSVQEILNAFPPERFVRMIREEDDLDFVTLLEDQSLPSGRFFLLATSRARPS